MGAILAVVLSAFLSQGPVSRPDPVVLSGALQARGVTVELPADFDADRARALLEDLASGLDALPPRAQRFPGGPLRIVLRPEPSDFGMGSADPSRPEWSSDRSTFFLYAYEEPPDPRALSRLTRLSREERERLWRRRAMVHAALQRWDDLLHWSRRPEWIHITGWQLAGSSLLALRDKPTNTYLWAYSRARGMESPSLDLVTFAEEALVPVESLREDALDVDERVECQEFSKLRFLRSRLAGLERTEVPGAADLSARPRCPAFDAWADLAHLERIELVLSAPSGQRPQSTFGHLMIRPVHDATSSTTFERVTEVAALTGFASEPISFVARGLTGGYPTIFGTTSLGTVRAEHLDQDERTLRRFRLNLTPNERARVMERLWELERRGYYPYYFFSDNCASYVAFALNGALEGGRHIEWEGIFVLPTGVLDAAARVETVDERGNRVPLLVDEPDDWLSHRARASEAERRMEAVLDALVERAPTLGARWRAFADSVKSSDLSVREAAYRDARALVQETLDLKDARAGALAGEMVELAVLMERYVAQTAEEQMRAIDRRRIVVPAGLRLPTAEEVLVARQVRFQRESHAEHVLESVREYVRIADLLENMPRRPPTPEEAEAIALAKRERQNWFAATALHGDVVEAVARASEAAGRPVEEGSGGGEVNDAATMIASRSDGPHLRFSGLNRFALGVGVFGGPNGAAPVVITRSAFLRERLGERRELGLDPCNELRILDGYAAWSAPRGYPEAIAVDLTPLGFMALPREPSIARRSLLDGLGFGLAAEFSRWPDRHHPGVHRWHADALVPLWVSASYERHLLFSVGVEGEADSDWLPVSLALGPRAGVIGRLELPVPRAQALRLRAFYVAPLRVLGDRPAGVRHQVLADAALEVEVGPAREGWIVEAGARAEITLAPDPQRTVFGTLALEWP